MAKNANQWSLTPLIATPLIALIPYLMMAKEEVAIRQDPVGQASNVLKKVFGTLMK